MLRGLIIKSTGKFYNIRNLESNETVQGIIRGKFKLQGLKLTNPVAVGDFVGYEMEDDLAVIKKIEERRNYVVRQSPRNKHNLHFLASNVDQVLLVVTVKEPRLKQGFIDRFLLMTEPYNIPVIIVFNKSDLFDEGDYRVVSYLTDIYKALNYEVFTTSTISGDGIEDVRQSLLSKTTLIAGQSGVGKSSLLNVLYPDLELRTKQISNYSGKGQHTTTFAEMFDLDQETKIIDTPGIKTLSFNHLEVMDVAHNFREFFIISEQCKYRDCTHRNEPKCAVKEGIESGEISELRYSNYVQILYEIENQNYWERITDY